MAAIVKPTSARGGPAGGLTICCGGKGSLIASVKGDPFVSVGISSQELLA